jgi:hypothetical protein
MVLASYIPWVGNMLMGVRGVHDPLCIEWRRVTGTQ